MGLVVMRFKGKCQVEGWAEGAVEFGPPSVGSQALGSTEVVNGHVQPFSEIQCDRIREALTYLDPATGRKERQRALGVALARVVAHELYHMLAHTTQHAASGLAKASESLQDLVGQPEQSFGPRESRAIGNAFHPKGQ